MFTTNIINYFFFFDKAGFSKTHPSFLNLKFFSKINPSFFTIKEGSTSHLGLLPSGKKRKPLLLVALNRYAIRLADHQRSTPTAELRFFVRDEPQGYNAGCLMLIARNLQELLFMGTQGPDNVQHN